MLTHAILHQNVHVARRSHSKRALFVYFGGRSACKSLNFYCLRSGLVNAFTPGMSLSVRTPSPFDLADYPLVPRSEEELVMLAREGDSCAFGELIQRHFAGCFRRAFAMLRNRTDAEDEVQNTFSKAFENLSRFRSEGPFSAWLYRILQNQCRMLIRQRRQSGFVYVDATAPSNARLELVEQLRDQEDELGARQVDILIREQLSRVPPLLRNVIELRDIEGLPMPEVAQRLGLSVPAAKSRLMRARREMRVRLKKHYGRQGPHTLVSQAAHKRVEYTYVS